MDNTNRSTHGIWAEKYRPSSLESFAITDEIRGKLEQIIERREMPHLLLYGPPGTGKTSLALFLASTLEADYKHINASDESGIDIVRYKIRPFAETLSFAGLKIVILDEFERMTPDAQDALRSLMEIHSQTTRFILTTNYIEKVTSPIRSRCQEFQINQTTKVSVATLIANILTEEKIKYDNNTIVDLVNQFHPDIRKCINETQKSVDWQENRLVKSLSQVVNSDLFCDLVLTLLDSKSKTILNDFRLLVKQHGITTFNTLYRALYDWVPNTKDAIQSMLYLIIAESQYQDVFVVDKEIAATNCISKIINTIK